MLWNILKYLGIEQERKKREFQFIVTHDVDHIARWKDSKKFIRSIGGDIIKRKNPALAFEQLIDYSMVKMGKRKDPYDTFDWLMV